MTAFLLAAAALLVLVLVVLGRPLIRRTALAPVQNSSEALAILREQRADLEADRAAGRIDEAGYATGLAELERRALDESVPAEETAARPAKGAAIGLAVALPLASLALYLILGNPPALDPANRVAQAPAEHALSAGEIDAMVERLAERIKANPEDLEGTYMLARSYMVLGRFQDAARTFAALAARRPGDAQVHADWADALAAAQGNQLDGEPARLIARALALDPKNVKALALSGTLAFHQGQYRRAAEQLAQAEALLPADSELKQGLAPMLAEARQRAGLPAPAAAAPADATASGITVTGRVTLDPALQSRLPAGATLFIFARPAAGGPPLAALRLPATLPLDFDFRQAQSMGMGAPDGPLIIGARISASGTATPAAGDLQGFSEAVALDARGVAVRIGKVVE